MGLQKVFHSPLHSNVKTCDQYPLFFPEKQLLSIQTSEK